METYSERVRVLERLRQKDIVFPDGWNSLLLDRQHQSKHFYLGHMLSVLTAIPKVITWLLQHDPDKRPTALELSQSSLLPKRMGEEYFRHALGMMGMLSCYSCNFPSGSDLEPCSSTGHIASRGFTRCPIHTTSTGVPQLPI